MNKEMVFIRLAREDGETIFQKELDERMIKHLSGVDHLYELRSGAFDFDMFAKIEETVKYYMKCFGIDKATLYIVNDYSGHMADAYLKV